MSSLRNTFLSRSTFQCFLYVISTKKYSDLFFLKRVGMLFKMNTYLIFEINFPESLEVIHLSFCENISFFTNIDLSNLRHLVNLKEIGCEKYSIANGNNFPKKL
uniref:Uncharacterized protein n=1 Tax=Cacopsylla melanoneura TaxID=428564 RepID=A0A8D8TLR4_9HEMI